MTLPVRSPVGDDLQRLREEVRRLEEAERFTEALQAIRSSGLASTEPAIQPDIARLRQAARLQASYRRACQALEAGEEEAAALLAAVVAVDPRYKDAAQLLYETVSGGRVAGLEAEVAASREAASRVEAQRDRLARGRARYRWVALAQAVVLCALCGLLGWTSRRRPPSPAAVRSVAAASSGGATVTMEVAPAPPGTEGVIVSAAPPPAATGAAAQQGVVSSLPGTTAPGAAPEDGPPEPEGPCHTVGESCWSTTQCCFGSMCYGTTCQDTRRTIVFGKYRP
jgi:hypothetical protein